MAGETALLDVLRGFPDQALRQRSQLDQDAITKMQLQQFAQKMREIQQQKSDQSAFARAFGQLVNPPTGAPVGGPQAPPPGAPSVAPMQPPGQQPGPANVVTTPAPPAPPINAAPPDALMRLMASAAPGTNVSAQPSDQAAHDAVLRATRAGLPATSIVRPPEGFKPSPVSTMGSPQSSGSNTPAAPPGAPATAGLPTSPSQPQYPGIEPGGAFDPKKVWTAMQKQNIPLDQQGRLLEQFSKMANEDTKRQVTALLAETRAQAAGMRAYETALRSANQEANLTERTRHDQEMEDLSRQRIGAAAAKGAAGPTGMDEGAVDLAAQQYLDTGKMPPLGFSGSALRVAILNRAAQFAADEGISAKGVPGKQASFKANSTALTVITKDLTAISPYKEMVDKNGDILKELAAKVTKTDVTFANRTVNWLAKNMGGDPDVAEYLAQVRIFQTEAARVLNNPRLTGQLTDTARQEIEGVIGGDLSLAQTNAVVDRLRSDADNRVNAMTSQSEKLRDKLAKPMADEKPGASSAKKPPAGWVKMKDAKGNVAWVNPKNKSEFMSVQ